MRFRIGDHAFYPSYGIGKIVGIAKKKLEEIEQTFYHFHLIRNGCSIFIPVHRVKELGLRPLMGRKDISRIFQILRKSSHVKVQWNHRLKEYEQKIRKGSPFETAEVLRDLMILQFRKRKELSFRERQLLELAKNLLIEEIVLATGEDEETISGRIFSEIRPKRDKKMKKGEEKRSNSSFSSS
jgi:CarD family transcriptional regulator